MTHIVRIGNVLDHPRGFIVHGCNCQGVMGSGVARAVRERYPRAFIEYRSISHQLYLGLTQIVLVDPGKWIVNAMTQQGYGSGERHVNYDAVAVAFEHVRRDAHRLGVSSIAYPLIGAGLGGGNWKILRTIIDETLAGQFEQVLYGSHDQLRALGEL